MVIKRVAFAAAPLVLSVAALACRQIVGLNDYTYEPQLACGKTTLPAGSGPRVRLVNAGTKGAAADFCLRASGTSDWGTSVFVDGGPSCLYGMSYAQATVPFSAPAAKFDVKAIAAGALCDAPATSELDGVAATVAGPVVTLIRYGGGHDREAIVALPEEATGNTELALRIRTVNALGSGESIFLGFASSPTLPATVDSPILRTAIRPGAAEPMTSTPIGPIDASGYLQLVPSSFNFGVQLAGNPNAIFTFATQGQDTETAIAVGDSTDPAHLPQGLVCDEAAQSDSIFEVCALSSPAELLVDTFNIALYGAEAPFNDQRRSSIYQAIAARNSDLMCVLEADLASDKAGLAKAAAGQFPYAYSIETNLDTVATDPTNAEGLVPPPPQTAPCAGVDPSIVSSIFQCVAQNCATPADMTGTIQTTACLSHACLEPFLGVFGPHDACFDCIAAYLSGQSTVEHVQQECTTDTRAPFAYDGANGTLILSHHPLSHTQAFIFPGTLYRRVALYAQVQLGSQNVDFYCAQLISPLIDPSLPYTGVYGMDATLPDGAIENGYADEQLLQVGKLVPWIQKTSAASGNPAIIAGDWHASLGVSGTGPDGGVAQILVPASLGVVAALDHAMGGAFVRADPPAYQPGCDYCPAPQNVLNVGGVQPEDYTSTFLRGFPGGAALEESFWGTQNTVTLTSIPYEPAPAGGLGPISPYYPRAVKIKRPPN